MRAKICVAIGITPDEFDELSPETTDHLFREIQRREEREDRLVARIGLFLFSAHVGTPRGRKAFTEEDFMPRRPLSENQKRIIEQVEAMKIEAAIKKGMKNG